MVQLYICLFDSLNWKLNSQVSQDISNTEIQAGGIVTENTEVGIKAGGIITQDDKEAQQVKTEDGTEGKEHEHTHTQIDIQT